MARSGTSSGFAPGTASAPQLLGTSGDSLREAFGRALAQQGAERPDVVVLDADIAGGTGAHHFRAAHPERFLQCGIAEQNMMSMAGGLAAAGLHPVVTTFAVFCLRAIEQARLSLAYPGRRTLIAASHPGLDVGPDGASAQALEDLAAFRAVPGMAVVSPADPLEMAWATAALLRHDGPVYVRTGRSPARRVHGEQGDFVLGRGSVLRPGADLTLVACGVQVARALDAAELLAREGVDARVVNLSTLKPIDRGLLERCAEETGAFVTAEDHNIHGGLGSAVAECLAETLPCPLERVGVRDRFGRSGDPEELAERYGLTGPHIAAAARRVLRRKSGGRP